MKAVSYIFLYKSKSVCSQHTLYIKQNLRIQVIFYLYITKDIIQHHHRLILSFFKNFWDLMSFSHWVFIIEIATRYGRWFPLDKSLRLSISGMEE